MTLGPARGRRTECESRPTSDCGIFDPRCALGLDRKFISSDRLKSLGTDQPLTVRQPLGATESLRSDAFTSNRSGNRSLESLGSLNATNNHCGARKRHDRATRQANDTDRVCRAIGSLHSLRPNRADPNAVLQNKRACRISDRGCMRGIRVRPCRATIDSLRNRDKQ